MQDNRIQSGKQVPSDGHGEVWWRPSLTGTLHVEHHSKSIPARTKPVAFPFPIHNT